MRRLSNNETGPSGTPMLSLRGAWVPTATYYAGDVVTNGGLLYAAPTNVAPAASFNAASWTQIGSSGAGGPLWLDGGTMTGAFAAAANTAYTINFPASLGAAVISLPTSPANGTTVAFSRADTNHFSSFANVTPSGSDVLQGGLSTWAVSASSVVFLYKSGVWSPLAVGYSGMAGLTGPTPSAFFGNSLMSRDSSGRAQVQAPSAALEIANKGYADTKMAYQGVYDVNRVYNPNDVVLYNNQLWTPKTSTVMPTPVFVNSNSITYTSAGAFAMPLPTNSQAGDLLVAFYSTNTGQQPPNAVWGTRLQGGLYLGGVNNPYGSPTWEVRSYTLTAADITTGSLTYPAAASGSTSNVAVLFLAFRNAQVETSINNGGTSVSGGGSQTTLPTVIGDGSSTSSTFTVYAGMASSYYSWNNPGVTLSPDAATATYTRASGSSAAYTQVIAAYRSSGSTIAPETLNGLQTFTPGPMGVMGAAVTIMGGNAPFDSTQWQLIGNADPNATPQSTPVVVNPLAPAGAPFTSTVGVAGYGLVHYVKESNGMVTIYGSAWLQSSVTIGSNYTYGTLPAGYRPAESINVAAISNYNGILCRVLISTAGVISIVIYGSIPSNTGSMIAVNARYFQGN